MSNRPTESDEELRQKSNRTYQRIVASLSPAVAERYGYVAKVTTELEKRLAAAVAAENWDLAQAISAHLARGRKAAAMQ
jgi:hypothetical protein